MGRPRENRRVVTYSLAKVTIDRIEELRDWKQRKQHRRPSRVTFSEVIDDAIRELNHKAFIEDDDPTHGGRFKVEWMDTPKWQCPYCLPEDGTEAPTLAGGWVFCPYKECGKPRPESTYPEKA